MDNPSLINEEASFPSSNAASYGLAEIWPFVVIGDGGELGWNLSRNGSVDGSTVTERSGGSGRKRRDSSSEEESKLVSTSSGNEMNACDARCPKVTGFSEENGDSKTEMEGSSRSGSKRAKQSSTQSAEPPKDYIHVRARRGQATDSHSLAERARREKISERMKILQDLIPGCNKVIGKALVLDEIINYIQSLQRQVEFLSMKLEAVNSRTSLSIEGFPLKDFGLQTFDSAGIAFGSHTTREFDQVPPAEWLHMQVGGGFERAT